MIHTMTAVLTDGQYWGTALVASLITALLCGVVVCIAERMMEGAK